MRKISWKVQEKRLLTVAKWMREKVTPERFVWVARKRKLREAKCNART